MSRVALGIGCILAVTVIGGPGVSQPAEKSGAGFRATDPGRMQLHDIAIRDGAVVDDNTVVVVGATDGPEGADDADLAPNGWVLDLTRRAPPQRFTNGHSAPLTSVAFGHGMLATASTTLDPVLRVSDARTKQPVAAVGLAEKRPDTVQVFSARWLHKTPRLAVVTSYSQVQVFDPKSTAAPTRYHLGAKIDGWLSKDIAISPDDVRIACAAKVRQPGTGDKRAAVVVWGIDRDNPVAVPVTPATATDPHDWFAWAVSIGPRGDVIARRSNTAVEVPKGTAEKDVPHERRAVVRIDPERRQVVPTGMGTSVGTLGCAFDPSGAWLAVVGTAHPDGPARKDDTFASEVRVYEAVTARLVFREQVWARLALTWVSFSPSGKRLVAATANGVLHWWNVERP